jgi:hypothetical protein
MNINNNSSVRKAMIFSAGLGTRFKPWTDNHPKALALVNGKSLLQRNIEYLRQFGINDVIVNIHHFAEQVIDAINDNNGWGSNIIISDETDMVLETGGGLLKAKNLFIPGEKFITCNVDILTDLNLNKLIAFHDLNQPLISFGVTNRIVSPWSVLSRWKISTTSRLVRESRFPVGSSASSSIGLLTNARAIATRCCCPPDSWLEKCPSRSPRPTAPSAAMARSRRSRPDTPRA